MDIQAILGQFARDYPILTGLVGSALFALAAFLYSSQWSQADLSLDYLYAQNDALRMSNSGILHEVNSSYFKAQDELAKHLAPVIENRKWLRTTLGMAVGIGAFLTLSLLREQWLWLGVFGTVSLILSLGAGLVGWGWHSTEFSTLVRKTHDELRRGSSHLIMARLMKRCCICAKQRPG